MTAPTTPGRAHPLDLPAMAAYAVHNDLDAAQAARDWSQYGEMVRVHWRAVADAARMAVDLTAPERDLARLDKATRDHADVGTPGEVRRANANRAEAGLDLLPVPGEDASGEPAPAGEGGVLFPAGCDPDAADDDFTQDRHADLDPNAGEADPQVWGSE